MRLLLSVKLLPVRENSWIGLWQTITGLLFREETIIRWHLFGQQSEILFMHFYSFCLDFCLCNNSHTRTEYNSNEVYPKIYYDTSSGYFFFCSYTVYLSDYRRDTGVFPEEFIFGMYCHLPKDLLFVGFGYKDFQGYRLLDRLLMNLLSYLFFLLN